jgi:peptidoglycan/xylan/chitin deacetylase (PgdA/CDA1 family)
VSTVFARSVKACLDAAGHYTRRLRQDVFPGVAVLCYHGVRPDDLPPDGASFEGLHVGASELEAHCRLLSSACQPISLAEWRAAAAGGPPLPPRPVLVTFDDGYRSVLTVAARILERFGIPAAVFVTSDPIERGHLFWHDAVPRFRGAGEVERAKALAYPAWRAVEEAHRVPAGPKDPDAPLSVADLCRLAEWPGIEIGGHTAGHPILSRASRREQREEILRNKARLEAWTGRPVRSFAYPNGRPGIDYTAETVALLEEAGFDFAFTTREGWSRADELALERSRFLMLAGVSGSELAHRLAYSWRP